MIGLGLSLPEVALRRTAPAEEGGAPAWVESLEILGGTQPHTAISFTGDAAWSSSGGAAALATVLGEDVTGGLEAAWGTATYPQVGDLTASGMIDADGGGEVVAFIGGALSKILAGATLIYRCKMVTDAPTFSLFMIGNVDGSKFIVAGEPSAVNSTTCKAYSYNAINEVIAPIFTYVADPGSSNKIAITITPTRLEMSVNGSAAIAVVLDTSEYQSMVCAGIDPSGDGLAAQYIESVAIFDPVSLANLPTVTAL